ncbi:MAG TPA: hypothetical protein VIQ26_00070, partial [Microbacteriaceae bacterium]
VTSDTTVTAASAGRLSASVTVSGTSLPAGMAPVVAGVTRTIDGFTFTVTREPGIAYAVTSDAGIATLSGSTVTVSGLAAGATTTAHVTASATGVLDETTDVTGTAINAGVAPTFSSPVAADRGFVFTITNYSASFSYALSTSAGTITRNGNRVTVAGLAAGASAVVQVVATQNGYREASASVTGRAIMPAAVPVTGRAVIPAAAPAKPAAPVTTPAPPSVTSPPVETPPDATKGQNDSSALVPLHESKAGDAAVTSDGGAVSWTVSTSKTTVTIGASNGLSLTVAAQRNGTNLPLAADGAVEVQRSGQLWVTMAGFAPRSAVTIWAMSDSLELAVSRTDASGATGERVSLPNSLTAGVHTLVVTGMDAHGKSVTMQMGIRVLDAQTASAHSPAGGIWLVWPLAALVLLLLVAWYGIARRRRRREDEQAA